MCQENRREELNRREFVKQAGLLGAGAVTFWTGARAMAQTNTSSTLPTLTSPPKDLKPIPRRKFGKSDEEVSIIGVGGHHIGQPNEATGIRIIQEAMDHGINFMDNCWDYHDGKSEEVMGKALKADGRRDKAFLMTKVCTHGRDAKVAMKQLEDSLRRLQTDRIDLWQIHEVAYENDPENHFAEGGATEALLKAKEQGKVRFIGFTGHKDPRLHKRMLSHDYPFDAVQMPLNPFDATFRSFEQEILPILKEKGMAVIGMKSLGGAADMVKNGAVTAQEALSYAMSLPVTVTVSGMPSLAVLYQNLEIAGGFEPWPEERRKELAQRVAPMAADGRFEMYKVSAKFEGKEGRIQHGFPLSGA